MCIRDRYKSLQRTVDRHCLRPDDEKLCRTIKIVAVSKFIKEIENKSNLGVLFKKQ